MRVFVPVLLIGLLASCPIVCGTAHAMTGDCHGESGHPGRGQSSLPAPANDDDCLCNGALKVAEADSGVASESASPAPEAPFVPGTALAYALIPCRRADPTAPRPPDFGGASGAARLAILRC